MKLVELQDGVAVAADHIVQLRVARTGRTWRVNVTVQHPRGVVVFRCGPYLTPEVAKECFRILLDRINE